MGLTNLPPQVFDTIKSLSDRVAKLEYQNKTSKIFFAYGSTFSITPSAANTPTSATITLNPSPFGAIPPYVQVTPLTSVPGTTVTGWAHNGSTVTDNGDGTYSLAIVLVVTRTNTTATTLRWLAYQMNPNRPNS